MPDEKKSAKQLRNEAFNAQRRKGRVFHALPLAAVAAVAVAAAIVLASSGLLPTGNSNPDGIISETPQHIHSTLHIFNGGSAVTVPALIGISPSLWHDHHLDKYGQGMAPLHTHSDDNPGLIHVESVVTRNYTLGELFSIWGQPLGPTQTMNMVADGQHQLTLTSNGQRSSDWDRLVLFDGQTVEIHYDSS